ncbi:unnamed protein product [Linum tenue]|uniref:SHSP domain-containing protein n=1 Tax=Linum tenue TaxID=586396 RepID=A0AAV0N1B0_9ROSI|nr:unnamed protein product [Linum tenue]
MKQAGQQLQLGYQDFEPTADWLRNDAESHTFLLYLPGFRKEQLKVQVTSAGNLRISGEGPIVGDNRISRFRHEVSISSSLYDIDGITAKFEGGVLRIKLPKKQQPQESEPLKKADEQVPQKDQTDSESNLEKPNPPTDPKVSATDGPGNGTLNDHKTTPQDAEAVKQETATEVSSPGVVLNYREFFDGIVTKLKMIKRSESAGIVMAAGLMGLVVGFCLEKAVRSFQGGTGDVAS